MHVKAVVKGAIRIDYASLKVIPLDRFGYDHMMCYVIYNCSHISLSLIFQWSSKISNHQFPWEDGWYYAYRPHIHTTRFVKLRKLFWFRLEFGEGIFRSLTVYGQRSTFLVTFISQAKKDFVPAILPSHYIDLSIRRHRIQSPFKSLKERLEIIKLFARNVLT